jgi:hypothetical protein
MQIPFDILVRAPRWQGNQTNIYLKREPLSSRGEKKKKRPPRYNKRINAATQAGKHRIPVRRGTKATGIQEESKE